MAGNSHLHNANKNKKDEFYTQLADIELELKHYRKHFMSKYIHHKSVKTDTLNCSEKKELMTLMLRV